MSRYARFAFTVVAVCAMIAAALGGILRAGAGPGPATAPIVRQSLAPLHTALPSATATASPTLPPLRGARTTWRVWRNAPKLVNVPKISQFLVKVGPHTWRPRQDILVSPMVAGRRIRPFAANGDTIVLTGDATNYYANDITLAYGSDVYLSCQGMVATGDTYSYVVYPPNGAAAVTDAGITTNANGVCSAPGNGYANFNLSTPFTCYGRGTTLGNCGTADAAYPGVWVVGMYDSTKGTMVTETAIVADAALNFTTYANLGLTTPTYTFSPGGAIVVNASGLDANNNYDFGFVYTGTNPIPCDFDIPQTDYAAGRTVVCATAAEGLAGITALGGSLTQEWSSVNTPSTTGIATGTYDVQLYDTTTNEMIGHQQISVEPNTASWTLTPYSSSGATPPPGFNYNNIFATDGLLDQSVSGLTYAATGLGGTTGNTILMTVSDPNGVILTPYQSGTNPPGLYQTSNAACGCSAAETAGGDVSVKMAFPTNVAYQESLGPTATSFAPNVLTAQAYDNTTSAVLGSYSFQLLGYYASIAWPAGGTTLSAATTGTTAAITITNTGGSNYGSWNGDAITGFELSDATVANGEILALSSTTATDSAGNNYTITASGVGANTVITAAANNRNQGIPVGGTLTFNVTATVPAGDCLTPCTLNTQILPEHGITYSAVTAAANTVAVLNSTVSQSTVVPTLTWAVNSFTPAASNLADRVATFNQMMYDEGTAGSGAYNPTTPTNYYSLNMTLNNLGAAGGHKLSEILLTFPGSVDLNASSNVPLLETSPAGTGTWYLLTNSTTNGGGTIPLSTYGPNVIALVCNQTTADACGIANNASGTFTLYFGPFLTSFTATAITASANWDKGNGYGKCPACADAAYPVSASTTTKQSIAGSVTFASNMLASYSLNPTLMSMVFSPGTVGVGSANTSSVLTLTNTPTASDPNPDYVDYLNLTFPAPEPDPTVSPSTSGWFAWETAAGSRNWIVATCAKPGPTQTAPCSNPEPNAIAPGGQLNLNVNWSSATAGTQNVTWYGCGANGGACTPSTGFTVPITFSSTAATFGFTSINGVAVTSGSEAQVGSDEVISGSPWTDKGSAYTMSFTNSGSNALDKIVITVPYLTRAGTAGTDGKTGNSGFFDVTQIASIVYGGGASGCGTDTIVNPTSTANGSITITGASCTIPTNGTLAVTFDAQTPYTIGQEYLWPANVYATSAPTTAIAGIPNYTAADYISVVLNGTLTIITPANGYVNPTSPNNLTPIDNTLSPQTNCVSCIVSGAAPAPPPATIDFGVFNGTFNSTDVLDASVLSDANSLTSNSWTLYVTANTNPSSMLYSDVDNTAGRSSASISFVGGTTTLTVVPTSALGMQLSSYSSTPFHGPQDNVMNFQVKTGGNTSAEAVTLTYTLVFN